MTISLFIDIITIALLAATIVYAFTLNRRIQLIHENRDELRSLLQGFSSSLQRAEIGIEKLKVSGSEMIETLESNLGEARTIRDDLQFLVERGEQIANALEAGIRNKREESADFSHYLGAAHSESTSDEFMNNNSDEMVISEVKKKLIGRLRTLR